MNDSTELPGSLIPPAHEPSTHDDAVRAMIDSDPGPQWDDDSPYIVQALERMRGERDGELHVLYDAPFFADAPTPFEESEYAAQQERREMEREGRDGW